MMSAHPMLAAKVMVALARQALRLEQQLEQLAFQEVPVQLAQALVDDDKAHAVVEHLMGDGLFSGWGVRTMASSEGGYNPIEYHNGTVWPHDNFLIAAGLRRYGYCTEATRLAYAILEAATYFEYRLPEVFAGYPRTLTHFPVEYPTASSPQAWATGTPFLLLRVMLGLEPEEGTLRSDPVLPEAIGELELRRVRGRWQHAGKG